MLLNMSEESILNACSSLLAPIQKQIDAVQSILKDELAKIPLKIEEALHSVVKNWTEKFEIELRKRDERIEKLEEKIASLSQSEIPTPKAELDIVDFPRDVKPFEKSSDARKSEKEVILVGDSIVKHVDMERLIGSKNSHLEPHIGFDVVQIRNKLVDIDSEYTAKKLVVHVGTNSIPRDSTSVVFSQILQLADDINIRMPKLNSLYPLFCRK